jgi:hypothetical protein
MYSRGNFLAFACCVVSLNAFLGGVALGEAGKANYVVNQAGERPKPIVAVDNVCAWPNLTVLGNGTIIATIHNQPVHLKRPADVDCWASEDGGRTWTKRGTPAPRDNERVARGNVAAGMARNGDLIVITSGWSDPVAESRGTVLPLMVSRSTDGGHTWSMDTGAFLSTWPEVGRSKASPDGYLIPFGDVIQGKDGGLRAGFYGLDKGAAFVYRSDDDGKTWGKPVPINKDAVIHEPALFHGTDGAWLVATRHNELKLYTSEDDAQTWTYHSVLTGEHELPGHFVRLQDGRILLSYGNRSNPKGVDVRVSDDEGATWSAPFRVMDFMGDGGYPSSVQLPDGQVVTAYYAQKIEGHDRYHMGVVIWDPAKTRTR